ncbi:MAG: HAMP domain-containing sensor histidine kinase [Desulfuromonadaceae bacterium]|nr:HAMP domain-containing sensor histidine kinase [Desulfuromonadaceae bacterium]
MKNADATEYSFEYLARLNWASNQMYFLRGFAHDFKNPINSILLGSKLLHNFVEDVTGRFDELDEETGCLPSGFRENGVHILASMPQVIQGISDSAQMLDQFVSYLSEFTGEGSVSNFQTVDINQLAILCSRMIQPQIRKYTKRFTLDIENNLPVLAGSAQQILQVMNNLLMNALHSLPDRSCEVVFSASCSHDTGRVQLSIRDQGVGVSPDILPHIFEPFFSTRQEDGCMGLGLTVSDQIIRNHAGELSVDSELGQGTCVLVSLPIGCVHA